MTVKIRIPTPLRSFSGGADEVELEAATVREALEALSEKCPGIGERILTPEGAPRQFVNVFVGTQDIRRLQGIATALPDGAVLAIVPAVAGGVAGIKAKDRELAELRRAIPEISPAEALALQARGAVLVDVREAEEIAQGSPVGAQRLGRGFLELRIEDAVPDPQRPVVVMCNAGVRSLFAAADLRRLGYLNLYSMAGGFHRWKSEGLPFELPSALARDARERYSRHLAMPEIGEAGQARLLCSKVLLVGAGGLGSPAALYLAAAGVGTLGVVDHDVVDRSNLQRQILHADSRVGMSKVTSAQLTLLSLNPGIKVKTYDTQLNRGNVEEIFAGWQVVLDGSDNFPTRYLVNDACLHLDIPNVHGSVYRFEGQASVFWPRCRRRRGPCYRCLYPEPPPPELAPSCAEAGVLGVLPGVIGMIQAIETIKLLLDLGDPLVGRLLCYDALRQRFTELELAADPHCRYCGEGQAFPGYVDYVRFCSAQG